MLTVLWFIAGVLLGAYAVALALYFLWLVLANVLGRIAGHPRSRWF